VDAIKMLFGRRTDAMTPRQQLVWRQAFGSVLVPYAGPACFAWRRGSDDLCEHDSCWDIMTEGASAYYRKAQELTGALC
jgi:hypothetical protein